MASDSPLHRRLKIRHLEVLAALGWHGSVHRAARELAVTQPAVSKLLAEIEEIVGTRLFDRSPRGVRPTIAGAALVARASRALGVIDGARDELAAIEAGVSGLVQVGASAVASAVLVPRAVALLREQGIALRVRVEESGMAALLASLRAGALDCVIGRVLDADVAADLSVEPLDDPPPQVVARPGHPMGGRRDGRAAWRAAAQCEWVLPPPSAPLRRIFAAWLARRGLGQPRCTLETVSILATVTAVRESDCLALLPGVVADNHARLGLLAAVRIGFDAPSPPVALLRRGDEPAGASLEAFCAAVRRAGRWRDEALDERLGGRPAFASRRQ